MAHYAEIAGAVALVLLSVGSARADDLTAIKPALMCISATALGQLTLPSGDSKTHRPGATPQEKAEMQAGGCRDIQVGTRVTVVELHKNTALIAYQGQNYTVPVIDFSTSGLAKACYQDSQRATLRGTLALRRATGDDAPHGDYDYPVLNLEGPLCLSGGNNPVPSTSRVGLQYTTGKLPPHLMGKAVTASGALTEPDNGNQLPEKVIMFDPVVRAVH